jgi:hypothetical protein
MLTASFLIELVQQGHAASSMEKYYLAWKLLPQGRNGYVFFKEIKHDGWLSCCVQGKDAKGSRRRQGSILQETAVIWNRVFILTFYISVHTRKMPASSDVSSPPVIFLLHTHLLAY